MFAIVLIYVCVRYGEALVDPPNHKLLNLIGLILTILYVAGALGTAFLNQK